MSRIIDAKCKICRREGVKLYLKGAKCDSPKCPLTRKPKPPGEFGVYPRKSGYGTQLREKQKVKRIYGLNEEQFRRFFRMAEKDKRNKGVRLLQLLEMRLDNVVYRLGFAESRNQARQLVRHGHVKVNKKKVNIPSYVTDVKDEITVADKVRTADWYREFKASNKDYNTPQWLGVKAGDVGVVVTVPTREMMDPEIREELVVEFYSR